jgi:hypothetical protein
MIPSTVNDATFPPSRARNLTHREGSQLSLPSEPKAMCGGWEGAITIIILMSHLQLIEHNNLLIWTRMVHY